MIWVFIWSQIKSFRHNLFLNYYQKTSLTKVSTFDQLNTKMLSENYMGVHLVTNKVISSQPILELLSKNFFNRSFYFWSIEYKNAIRKLNGCSFGQQIKSFRHILLLTSNQKTFFKKVSTFDLLNKKRPPEKWYWCSFGQK